MISGLPKRDVVAVVFGAESKKDQRLLREVLHEWLVPRVEASLLALPGVHIRGQRTPCTELRVEVTAETPWEGAQRMASALRRDVIQRGIGHTALVCSGSNRAWQFAGSYILVAGGHSMAGKLEIDATDTTPVVPLREDSASWPPLTDRIEEFNVLRTLLFARVDADVPRGRVLRFIGHGDYARAKTAAARIHAGSFEDLLQHGMRNLLEELTVALSALSMWPIDPMIEPLKELYRVLVQLQREWHDRGDDPAFEVQGAHADVDLLLNRLAQICIAALRFANGQRAVTDRLRVESVCGP